MFDFLPLEAKIVICLGISSIVVLMYILYKWSCTPTEEELESRRMMEERIIHFERACKEAAEKQKELLPIAEQNHQREQKASGLEIIGARYKGICPVQDVEKRIFDCPLQSYDKEDRPALIVTNALRYLIKNSTLHLPGGISKSKLPGFSDPCPNESKELLIVYRWRGNLDQIVVADTGEVKLGGQIE